MKSCLLQIISPEKNLFPLGITAITTLKDIGLIIGSGEGLVQEMSFGFQHNKKRFTPTLTKSNKIYKVIGSITSISLRGEGHQFYVATDKCHLYRFNFADFTNELINTCHYSALNDIKFPNNCSDVFVTCSYQDVRVYNTKTQKELLRINVPNMTCFCMDILHNGTAIVSGWDDSKIRAFFPESGRVMYEIEKAHKKGVTAIATTSNPNRIISGGGEGQVRVWDMNETKPIEKYAPYSRRANQKVPDSKFSSSLVAAMFEHTNAVTCIKITKDDRSCVSASADSTCIIWCLETFRRKQIIFSNTLFRCICYHPSECQIIASGTNRKIGYWEVFDGALIRELDGSQSGSINGLDISEDGNIFVTGGNDYIVKIWKYNEGEVTHIGLGHTSPITRLRISPDQRHVITVSEDGAIYIWDMPPMPNEQ